MSVNTTESIPASYTPKLTKMQQIAQNAVLNEPEVAEMAKRLAKYGLGIFMPHMHTAEEDFADLPEDKVQLETSGSVRFMSRGELKNVVSVPVGWRWQSDGMGATASCLATMNCELRRDFATDGYRHVSIPMHIGPGEKS
jgi:hypothetical protein